MAEPVSGTHPDATELQKYADREAHDERVASHVESCAACRDEVAAIRRVTAALSLGSRAPDTLAASITERRAHAGRAPLSAPLRPSRSRFRPFLLPVGLAAAAALAIILPRASREPVRDVDPAPSGVKGAVPSDAIVFEAILTDERRSALDSVVQALSLPGTTVEISYVAGRNDSARAQRIAERVAGLLRGQGVDESVITVRRERSNARTLPLPDGAVAITVRSHAATVP